MMTRQKKGLWVGGMIAAAVAALTLGVPLNTLLLLGALLLCPAAMYFGMSGMGMQQGCGHSAECHRSNEPEAVGKTEDHQRQRAA